MHDDSTQWIIKKTPARDGSRRSRSTTTPAEEASAAKTSRPHPTEEHTDFLISFDLTPPSPRRIEKELEQPKNKMQRLRDASSKRAKYAADLKRSEARASALEVRVKVASAKRDEALAEAAAVREGLARSEREVTSLRKVWWAPKKDRSKRVSRRDGRRGRG